MKDLVLGFLSKTLNLDKEILAAKIFKTNAEGKVTDELNEAALQDLLGLDADRVKKLREGGASKDELENQYKRGKKEALTDLEKSMKSKYDITDEKTGLDLVDAIASKLQGAKLDDEKVKMHPLYLGLQDTLSKKLEDTKTEYETKIKGIETDYVRKDTFAKVADRVKSVFDASKPILPADTAKAALIRDEFVKNFEGYDFEVLENGKILPSIGGKRKEDDHGNPIYLDDLVKIEVTRRWDLKAQDDKGGGGNNNNGGGGITVPKTLEEKEKAIYNAKTAEERIAIHDAWEQSNNKSA